MPKSLKLLVFPSFLMLGLFYCLFKSLKQSESDSSLVNRGILYHRKNDRLCGESYNTRVKILGTSFRVPGDSF